MLYWDRMDRQSMSDIMNGATESQPEQESPCVDQEFARLTLDDTGPEGDTLADYDGLPINVFGGIAGEEVIARIVRHRRRGRPTGRVSAMVTQVLKPSPHRVAPPCPYFGSCSGCQWQHIDYSHQLSLKREAVAREIGRLDDLNGVPVSDTLPSPQQFGYRNHARFTVRRQGALGYINRITRRFVTVDSCMLMSPWINGTLHAFQGLCKETSQISVRYGINTSEWLIQPALSNEDVPLTTGQTHYREALLGKHFRIASPSFFQVNTRQAERLALLVREHLKLTGVETLVDAYSGVGAFAVLLAPSVRRVIAIEESEAAIRDSAVNTLGIKNLEFRQGKVEDVLPTLDPRPDVVVLDPPRVGCHPAALQAVVGWAPRRTAYVSCDPETLARDLRTLVRGGLRVEKVEPVDMFPQTHHVECVATLTSAD